MKNTNKMSSTEYTDSNLSVDKSNKHTAPPITIEDESLRPMQNLIATATIVIPFIGTLIAVAQMFTVGVGWLEIGLLIIMSVLSNLGIEFGLHRNLAHRAFKTFPIVRYLFAILGSMAAQGRILYWVASHRRHHIHSDTINDPHSPHVRKGKDNQPESLGVIRGLWHAHVGHMLNDNITNCALFAADINRDPVLVKINKWYGYIVLFGLMIPAIIGGLWTGSWQGTVNGFLWGGLVRMFLVHQITWSVASFSHRFGKRPFDTGDMSANNIWTAIPSFGSGLQNNHHAFPTSAYLGLKWWEIDMTAWFIRVLAWLGIVWDVKHPTAEQIEAKLLKPAS